MYSAMDIGLAIADGCELDYAETAFLQDMGENTLEIARQFFADCGAGADFCVQYVSPFSIVFGGTNRLIYHPFNGTWTIDLSVCTPNFREKWAELLSTV